MSDPAPAPESPTLPPAEAPERPSAALEALLGAFESGNYARARTLATALLNQGTPEEQSAAQDLLERLSPAPIVKYLLLLTAILLTVVTVFSYLP